MTNIKLGIILILAICLCTSVFSASPNLNFCDTASHPGSTTMGPNFETTTQNQNQLSPTEIFLKAESTI